MNNCPLGDKYKLKMSLAKKDGPCTGFYEKDDNSGVCSRCPACEKCSFLDPLAVSPVSTFYPPPQQIKQTQASPYIWYTTSTTTDTTTKYPYQVLWEYYGGEEDSYDSSWWVVSRNEIYKEEEE